MVQGKYRRRICPDCLVKPFQFGSISSGYQGYDRRRQYEDHAQDTVQPYDAMGKPRAEFYRLYPDAAAKVFNAKEIEEVRRKI